MFINKLPEKSNSSKMSSYINLFLKTEITCIPKLLQNYLGNYYSNALCNGATWVFVLWCVLHIIFDKIIDVLLRKFRYSEYIRIRLKSCLWYLGFYGTALVYCGATLAQNEVELFNFKKMHVPSNSSLPTQVILGYTLISTFYLHSSLWEGLTKESFIKMFSYLFLFTFLVTSYILRIVEVSFTLTALIGIAQVAVEFTRCCFITSNQDTLISKLIVGMLYFITFAIYIAIYIIIIPMTFVVPYGLKIMSDYPNILLLFLFTNMVLWLMTDIYQSILFRFVDHWFYHEKESKEEHLHQCSGGLLECSLFKPRDDISYNLQILREEIKARETKMMSMRKPKNKNMLIQTLKCMVAIKRKLNEKRLSDSSDSDDSEKSEDSDLRTSEHTDDDTGELQSDQDEESDDEESESQESVIETSVKKQEPEEPDKNKRDNDKEPEDKNIDFIKLGNSNVRNECNIEVKPMESKDKLGNKCDNTKESGDANVDFSKPNISDHDCNSESKAMDDSNTQSKVPAENKCDNTKESEEERIDFSKPDSCNDNADVTSIEKSNIKSEEPTENKCDPVNENIESIKPNNDNCAYEIHVKLTEESNVEIKNDIDESIESNQVCEKASNSVNDETNAQSVDNKNSLQNQELKESHAVSKEKDMEKAVITVTE